MIQPGASDSAALDNVFEAAGARPAATLPMAKSMLIPEAWATNRNDAAKHRAHVRLLQRA